MKICKNITCKTMMSDQVIFCPKCGSLNGDIDNAVSPTIDNDQVTPTLETPSPIITPTAPPIFSSTSATEQHLKNDESMPDVELSGKPEIIQISSTHLIIYWWILVFWSLFYSFSPLVFSNYSNYSRLFELTGDESTMLRYSFFLMTVGLVVVFFAFPFFATRYMAIRLKKPAWVIYGVLSIIPWYAFGVVDFGKIENWSGYNVFDWIGSFGIIPWFGIQLLIYSAIRDISND